MTTAPSCPNKGAMRRLVSSAALLFAASATVPAFAEQNDNESWDGAFSQRGERRSDFVIGFSPGLVLNTATGYPNEITKLDDPSYRATSGFAVGPGFEAWIGGALTDWFTFGVGGAYLTSAGKDSSTSAGAFLVRVETFPLYGLGGGLRDLALFANFGAGGLGLKGLDQKHASAGFASIGGGGIAYEVARMGPFAFAPTAEYLLIASQSLTAHQAIIGARVVFYGGPG